jgi:hypothetical protein
LKSGDTIVKAFIHAGFWALLSISILLWIVLRRIRRRAHAGAAGTGGRGDARDLRLIGCR